MRQFQRFDKGMLPRRNFEIMALEMDCERFDKNASSTAEKLLFSPTIMFMALPAVNGKAFNYIDGVFAVWLIVGVVLGRKRGMTKELLPTLKWIAIVVLAGLFYSPFSAFIFKSGNGAFQMLTSKYAAYIIIAFAVNLGFISIKQALGEKLSGSDFFGRAEYYLGMMSGLIHAACILVVLCAILNARVYSDAELAEEIQIQKKNFEDIRFPTYMSIQHAILIESYSGKLIRGYLSSVLIASGTEASNKPTETMGKKKEDELNSIMGPAKK
jgi:uncharacterized membrane protein required for colicin V production